MTVFRILLVGMFAVLLAYTGMVIANHGWGLFQVFFSDMAKMGWAGQFNLDFMFMLTLSGFWVAWRHQFSLLGLVLALFAFVGGTPFLSIYLLVLSLQTGGDVRTMLLGPSRA